MTAAATPNQSLPALDEEAFGQRLKAQRQARGGLLPIPSVSPSLAAAGPYTLAVLTHDAEDAVDDLTFLTLQAEVERRAPAEQEAYRLAYLEVLKIRALQRKLAE